MAIRYTRREELWNTWSHAGGIVLGVAVGVLFCVMAFRGDNPWARLGVCLYLFGMLGSYIASTVYHALPRRSPWKERLRRWDHAAIYWHIAGSYSPLTLVALRTQGYWGWTLFCFVWLCAVAGTIVSFARLKEHSNVETFCFVGMGLSVLVAFGPLIDAVSTAALVWIVAEGVCYITGAVFYSLNKRRYMHSVFHFFVLAGSVCHIIAVWDVLMDYIYPPEADCEVELLLPMTPVKDQGDSDLCWAYAMLATIETEHLLRGDSVNLSGVYIRRVLDGAQPSASRQPSPRGQRAMCQTLLNGLGRWGMVGYDVLPDDATDDLPTPSWVFMDGARYTPQEFAHSVCAPDEYVGLTCLPDSPYYNRVVVPVPDNWEHNRLLNLPADTLRQRVDRALRRRHPVCWESATHAMAIMGLARDQRGSQLYILKNSWGTGQPHGGLVYMAADALWRDAVALYMTRDAYAGR